jgi:hypothetical protein
MFAGHTLLGVPVLMPGQSSVATASANTAGGTLFLDVLTRFNTFIDYQHDAVYLRPNSHFNDPYKKRGRPHHW